MKRTSIQAWTGLGLTLGGGALAFTLVLPARLAPPAMAADRAQAEKSPATPEQLRPAYALSDAFKAVTRAVSPAVVHIRAKTTIGQGGGSNPQQQPQQPGTPDLRQNPDPFGDEFMRRFFGEGSQRGFRFGPGTPQPPREREGQGTGVVIREDGYIVTNYHVAGQADEITVTLQGDTEYSATIVGTDPDTDLAVLKIEAGTLPAAKFGDSDKMETGDWVLAIGNPFGLDHSVTAGIVSAKGRSRMGLAQFEDFIQTDAAINPGNSGGPLVNLEGEVIGINAAISTRTGGNMGIGFAIPSNMVQSVVNGIIESGSVKRGFLGIGIQPLTEELAESFGFHGSSGTLVSRVDEDSPADKAGVKAKDIVTEVNGQPVSNPNELMNKIASMSPGGKVTLTLFRDGQKKKVDVTLGQRPSTSEIAAKIPGGSGGAGGAAAELGFRVQELTSDLARELGAPDSKGVVVTEVEPGSVAAGKGIARGDVIVEVGDRTISNVEDFTKAMAASDANKGIRLHVLRQGGDFFVVLKPSKR